jgi:TRAP-type C4-dicarboxylate transport system substrate-binding protein
LGLKSSEALSVLRDRLVEVNELISSNIEGELPLPGITNLPFVFRDEEQLNLWERDVFLPVFNDELKKRWNSRVLFSTPNYPGVLFFSKKPLAKPEDFKGVRIRTWGGITATALAAMGMAPNVIAVGELTTALQQGTVDATVTGLTSAYELKLWELLKYVNFTQLSASRQWGAVNLDALNALPKDLQDIVMLAGQDATNRYAYEVKFWPEKNLQALLKGGMKAVYPEAGTMAYFQNAMKPVIKKWAKDANDPRLDKWLKELGSLD